MAIDIRMPKSKSIKAKADKKKGRVVARRRGFQLRTKEGIQLEKNLDDVLNKEILENRRLPRSKLNKIFSTLCKTKTTRGGYKVHAQIKSQKAKTVKSKVVGKDEDDDDDDDEDEDKDDDEEDEENDEENKPKQSTQPQPKTTPAPAVKIVAPVALKVALPAVVPHEKCSPVPKNSEPR